MSSKYSDIPIAPAGFDTEEEREAAIHAFKTLEKNKGWQILKKVLKYNIDELEAQILGEVEVEKDFDADKAKFWRLCLLDLKRLPKLEIELLKSEDNEPRLDPYVQSKKEIDEDEEKITK